MKTVTSRWVRKAQVGVQVRARGSHLRGTQGDVAGEVAKRRMGSDTQEPAKKVRENKSVCLWRRRMLLTKGMGTGSMRDVRLRRKKSCLLFLMLSKMSSVFKPRTFQYESHANYPLLRVPHILCTLTPCLKHCTLFSGGWGWHAPGRHSWRDPNCGNPQVVLLQKPICVMTFSATVAKKTFFWGANSLVKTVWISYSASNLVLLLFVGCSMEYRGFFSDGVFLPRQNEEIHPSSVLIFRSTLESQAPNIIPDSAFFPSSKAHGISSKWLDKMLRDWSIVRNGWNYVSR